jgi:hypothetical protein
MSTKTSSSESLEDRIKLLEAKLQAIESRIGKLELPSKQGIAYQESIEYGGL